MINIYVYRVKERRGKDVNESGERIKCKRFEYQSFCPLFLDEISAKYFFRNFARTFVKDRVYKFYITHSQSFRSVDLMRRESSLYKRI